MLFWGGEDESAVSNNNIPTTYMINQQKPTKNYI